MQKEFEKVTKKNISLGSYGTHSYFPEALPELIKTLDSGFDRFELIAKINDFDQRSFNRSTVSITSITPIECLLIDRIDFVRIMSWEMYRLMLRDGYMYSISV
jgi:hypothetical protein